MTDLDLLEPGRPHRTQPIGLLVGAVSILRQLVFPLILAVLALREGPQAQWIFGLGGLGVIGFSLGMAYLSWKRRTFTIGEQDIRVESGVLSRSASSVPYERIQDVSLEQKFLPRLLNLVSVKFETGAGGAEDLTLQYMTREQGERLRLLVRERRSGDRSASAAACEQAAPDLVDHSEQSEVLFAMDPRRIITFGLFEFSLAALAVLVGLVQYIDNVIEFDLGDFDVWLAFAERQSGWLWELGGWAQLVAGFFGVFALVFIGLATGLARTISREWNFLLERTARGFRRRRGLFTRTDVVMPVHRVQGLTFATRFLRYRFGWHSLSFISLAQDAGSSSHVVAPFARLEELDPIIKQAGFEPPSDRLEWHRATKADRAVTIIVDCAIFVLVGLFAGTLTWLFAPEWMPLALGLSVAAAIINAIVGYVSWAFKRHALDDHQIVAVSGFLAPVTKIALREKLHSAEIVQGPLARRFGYATLHLGLAGGDMSVSGIALDIARDLRAAALASMAQRDFSQFEGHILESEG